MSDETDWSDQYEQLQKKYMYTILGQSLVPVKETTASGEEIIVGWEETDERPETDQTRDEVDVEMREFLSSILEREVTETASYKTQIQSILDTVECDVENGRLADVVGCSKSYVARFEYDEDRKQAIEREWWREYRKESVSSAMREQIVRRDNNQCRRCGSTDNLQVHHITPVTAGGENKDQNLATLCKECHKLAHGGSWTSPSVVYDEFESWTS